MRFSTHHFRSHVYRTRSSIVTSFSTSPHVQTPSEAYNALVHHKRLEFDGHQVALVRRYFDKLHTQLIDYKLPVSEFPNTEKEAPKTKEVDFKSVVKIPRGLYLYGGVGTGKSLLLDLFFRTANVQRKRRVHFNDFMMDLHRRLAREKTREAIPDPSRPPEHWMGSHSRDVVVQVAQEMADESHLLCFDEFQVTDVADALIMRKVFGVLFQRGVVMVATSNTPPQDLYKDGTNREYFMPFLDQLARHTKVLSMNSEIDYRLLCEPFDRERTFLTPLSASTRREMDQLYHELLADEARDSRDNNVQDELLHVPVMMGRTLDIRGSLKRGVCRASFDALCGTERGAADYKAIAERFHTVMLDDVPMLSMAQHDPARRFIVLVDELYEHRTQLVLSTEAAVPREIFSFDDQSVQAASTTSEAQANKQEAMRMDNKAVGVPTSSCDAPGGAPSGPLDTRNLVALKDLKIAFKRAVSRLHEMQSTRGSERPLQQLLSTQPPSPPRTPSPAPPLSSSLPPSALRRQQERDVILSFDAHPLGRHEAYFLLATKWLNTWTAYVCDATATSARPGPIDNSSLVDPMAYRVQPHLQPTVDYRGVSPQVYALFAELYGPSVNDTVQQFLVRYTMDLYAPPVLIDDVRAMLRVPAVRARAVVTAEVTATWPLEEGRDDSMVLETGLRPRDRDDETWAYKCCCRCAYLVPCLYRVLGGGPTYEEETRDKRRWRDYVCCSRRVRSRNEGHERTHRRRRVNGTEDESSDEESGGRDEETSGLLA
ncbi:unnamed protein product [Hyaloperonospora brassicae]|uniref:DUSP domain-containing protein n=1 Tax=Hyaloperonospora brassicae TaxID=162125 RepID=A0AAV0TGC5_HYABA|nr:unnamed protein product [Hyaloperonospora brassicae]